MYGKKSLENLKKTVDFSTIFSQNENIFVKMGPLFAHFEIIWWKKSIFFSWFLWVWSYET